MKKVISFFTVVVLSTFTYSAQAQEFEKGDGVISATIGFGSTISSGGFYTSSIPGIGVAFDYCVVDNLIDGNASIGVGGYFGISGSKWEQSYFDPIAGQQKTYGWKYTYIVPAAQGTFHYHVFDKVDFYGGLRLGFEVVTASEIGDFAGNTSSDAGSFYVGAVVGARYYFNDNWAALAELGYGIAYFNIGMSYRL